MFIPERVLQLVNLGKRVVQPGRGWCNRSSQEESGATVHPRKGWCTFTPGRGGAPSSQEGVVHNYVSFNCVGCVGLQVASWWQRPRRKFVCRILSRKLHFLPVFVWTKENIPDRLTGCILPGDFMCWSLSGMHYCVCWQLTGSRKGLAISGTMGERTELPQSVELIGV